MVLQTFSACLGILLIVGGITLICGLFDVEPPVGYHVGADGKPIDWPEPPFEYGENQ